MAVDGRDDRRIDRILYYREPQIQYGQRRLNERVRFSKGI